MTPIDNQLKQLGTLNFAGKAEAFVESRFITPLLTCLGYETHDDYEVLRHGNDGASFKLAYPPVERGAVKVKLSFITINIVVLSRYMSHSRLLGLCHR